MVTSCQGRKRFRTYQHAVMDGQATLREGSREVTKRRATLREGPATQTKRSIALRYDGVSEREHVHGTGLAHGVVELVAVESMLPTSLTAYGFVADQSLLWSRQLDSTESRAKTTIADASLLKDVGQALRVHLQNYVDEKRTDSPTLPLVAYYGTGRLFGAHRKKTPVDNPTSRLLGYDDCLTSASRYKHFEDWFERFSGEAQQERIDGQSAGHSPQEKLQAVKEEHTRDCAECLTISTKMEKHDERIAALLA